MCLCLCGLVERNLIIFQGEEFFEEELREKMKHVYSLIFFRRIPLNTVKYQQVV